MALKQPAYQSDETRGRLPDRPSGRGGKAIRNLTWRLLAVALACLFGADRALFGQTAPPARDSDARTRAETSDPRPDGRAGEQRVIEGALATALALEKVMIRAIERAGPSVVAIARVRDDEDSESQATAAFAPRPAASPTDPDFMPNEYGAGVVVGRDGYILTNYHVLGNPEKSKYYVWSQRRPFSATIVAADRWYDLAVLKVAARDLQPITFGDGSRLRKGQIVLALGNPQAIARDGEPSVSWGIISNILRRAPRVPRRSVDVEGRETVHHYGTLIQTDAKLNIGFSGGALIDLEGRMIGLTTSFAAGLGFESAAGFAIPVTDQFQRAVETLRQGRAPEYGFLGVVPRSVNVALRQQGILGARLVDVYPGTPAYRAGLREGDLVVKIAGQSVYDDDDLIRLIGVLPPDERVRISLVRANSIVSGGAPDLKRAVEVEVVLSKKHVASLRPAIGEPDERSWRGLRVEYATAVEDFEDVAERIDRRGCVIALEVEPDSPAWQAGLRNGELISRVSDTQVATPQEFYKLVREARGDVILRVITRQGSLEDRTVSP